MQAGNSLLSLSETESPGLPPLDWVDSLFFLGSRISRYAFKDLGKQLVVAISVPTLDYASVLIAAGWTTSSPAPPGYENPAKLLATLPLDTPVRAVLPTKVITDRFKRIELHTRTPTAVFSKMKQSVASIRAVEPLDSFSEPTEQTLSAPSSIEHWMNLEGTWPDRVAQPAADLGICGTITRIRKELDSHLRYTGHNYLGSRIRDLLLPEASESASWFTKIRPIRSISRYLDSLQELNCVILEGNTSGAYLEELRTPIIVCIVDRSSSNSEGPATIVDHRMRWGDPIAVRNELQWSPARGIETFAYTVNL